MADVLSDRQAVVARELTKMHEEVRRGSLRELAAHYAKVSGRDLAALDWYVVLACFKLGIILEGARMRAFQDCHLYTSDAAEAA